MTGPFHVMSTNDGDGGDATTTTIDESTANALLDETLKTILTKVVSYKIVFTCTRKKMQTEM